jgi:hypothetical protein
VVTAFIDGPPAPLGVSLPTAIVFVQAVQGDLQVIDEDGEIVFGRAPQQADERLDPFLLVVAQDLGDPALDRVLEGEQEAAELSRPDVDEVVAEDGSTRIDGDVGAGQRQGGDEAESGAEHAVVVVRGSVQLS